MRRWLTFALVLGLMLAVLPGVTTAMPSDWPVSNGHFYTQANGQGGTNGVGFAVTNDGGIPFWTEFNRQGGINTLGYPVSHRFTWEGFTVQAFQKAILQWQPGRGIFFVNVFDRLSALGKDAWLESVRATPSSFDHSADAGLSWDAVVQRHFRLLDANGAIRARYFADADPGAHFGLPMSYRDFGNVFVLRAQRAVLQQWRTDTPWARAGEVTVANGGDIAKELGILPGDALTPRPGGAQAAAGPADAVESNIVALTNDQRQAAGLPPVVSDDALANVARQRSQDLVGREYFSHYDPQNGTLLFDALLRQQYAGYRGGSGENLFQLKAGYPLDINTGLARQAVDGWMGSPTHRANLLNGTYRKMGIGIARSASGGVIAITQLFLIGG